MMRLFSISHRPAVSAVLALLTASAQAQAPDLFQSAPGPAPAARPAPRPRPPAAAPQPAVVAPQPASAPAAPARPEGALREAELRRLVDATLTETNPSSGSSWSVYNSPDGRAFLKGVTSGGRPNADAGRWSIENDTWCNQWDHFFFGRRNCTYVFKKGDGYETWNLDGTINARATSQPGNVYHLP